MLLEALEPILVVAVSLNPADSAAEQFLNKEFAGDGKLLTRVRSILRDGIQNGALCDREAGGVRYSRLRKAHGNELSIDVVHMSGPGSAHLHPRGEIDLCFSVTGTPLFDGRQPGWVVYPPNTWHMPTVTGGAMDILYFLPGGAIQFGPRPSSAHMVGTPP
jgi:hypothetical protein